MNVLFLTLLSFDSLQERTIYTDLLREFVKNGHHVYVISPVEKRKGQDTHVLEEDNSMILRLQIGNIQKTNIIEKGISTLTIESTFKKAIIKYFSDVKFDLILYSTPPITLVSAIEYVKKRDGAKTYLLLKDIFPQNAVDIGMMSQNGIKGILYRYFRKREKELYKISDRIGCMSQANVDYVINNNPEIDPHKVEICPNSIDIIDTSVNLEMRKKIRAKYGIPIDKRVFVYGGNLGKPQGIPFVIDCLKECSSIDEAFFLVIGDGTEYGLLDEYARNSKQKNFRLMRRLPKEDYDTMVGACDVGMVFLDYRFTIPNFPSRLLSYMQAKLPVLVVSDPNTDIGKIVTDGGFGWWCESNDASRVRTIVEEVLNEDMTSMGEKAFDLLSEKYKTSNCYNIIVGKY